MAMSLCAPVSFHHEKETNLPSASGTIKDDSIVSGLPLESTEDVGVVNNASLVSAVSLILPLTRKSPASNTSHTDDNDRNDCMSDKERSDTETPRRVRSQSDAVTLTDTKCAHERDSFRQHNMQVSSVATPITVPVVCASSDASLSAAIPVSSAAQLSGAIMKAVSIDGHATGSGVEIDDHEEENLPSIKSNSQSPKSNAVPWKRGLGGAARSTALRNASSPPSWSWTWGALPVKSSSKSSSDLLLMLENGVADGGAASPSFSAEMEPEPHTRMVSSSNTIASTDGTAQTNCSDQSGRQSVASSAFNSAANMAHLDFQLEDLSTAMTKGDDKKCTDFIEIDQNIAHSSSRDPLTLKVSSSQLECSDEHDSQNKSFHLSSGQLDGEFLAISELNDSSGSARVSSSHLHSSLVTSSPHPVVIQLIQVQSSSCDAKNIAGAGDGSNESADLSVSETALPSNNQYAQGGAITSEAVSAGQKTARHDTSTASDSLKYGLESVHVRTHEVVVELEGDGDTDQEQDTLSLHDIPLDQISPEPAGGDFYDSDTESYRSLSLDEGESGKSSARAVVTYRYRRVLVPSQEQLQSMDLQDGENDISFELQQTEVKGAYSNSSTAAPLRNQVFVWPYDAKIVIIDIEGAITAINKGGKGWGMGGFLSTPRSALHNGVAKLLTNIHKNGYHILYIAQSTNNALNTKDHLAKLSASSGVKLPPGPLFQSPDSLIRAFGASRTDLFKTAALRCFCSYSSHP